jgi:hypothetical protein
LKRRLLIVLAAVLPLLPLVGGAARIGDSILIRIINPHPDDREIEVVDNVCGQVILSKRLVGRGTIPVEVCAHAGKADVTLRNLRTGAIQRHAGVIKDAKLAAP